MLTKDQQIESLRKQLQDAKRTINALEQEVALQKHLSEKKHKVS